MPSMACYDPDPVSPDFDDLLINSSPDFGARNGTFSNRAVGRLPAVSLSASLGSSLNSYLAPAVGASRASSRGTSLGDYLPGCSSQLSFADRNKIVKEMRELDVAKNVFVENLLYQLESTEERLRALQMQRQASTQVDFEIRERSLQEQLAKAKEIMDRNAYVIVLIDGHGAIFNKELLSSGESGGKQAATRLAVAASDLVARRLPHLDAPKIVVRVYADVASLSDLLVRSQLIESRSGLDDFVRGFNGAKALFDFVDVGSSEAGAAADKVCELLKLNLYDCHCHQVVFAPSRARRYGAALEQVLQDSQLASHLTLVESVPVDRELDDVQSHFHSARFDSIFSRTKPAPLVPATGQAKTLSGLPALTKVESNKSNKTTTNSSASSTPALNWATITAAAVAAPPPPPPAPAVSKAASTASTSKPTRAGRQRTIQTNRFGQRIDDTDTSIPNYEIQRVKKLKLCNLYYLQGKDMCTSSACTHRHDYPISNSERRTLREVARMTPCYFRTECENADCIYGHQCPQNKPDEADCYFKQDCRYYGWGHGIDTQVVKTTKI